MSHAVNPKWPVSVRDMSVSFIRLHGKHCTDLPPNVPVAQNEFSILMHKSLQNLFAVVENATKLLLCGENSCRSSERAVCQGRKEAEYWEGIERKQLSFTPVCRLLTQRESAPFETINIQLQRQRLCSHCSQKCPKSL